MTFSDRLSSFISRLEEKNKIENDPSLQSIIRIFKSVNTINDLKKEKSLIDRIAIDSIRDKDTTEEILVFTMSYTKTK